MMRPLGAFIFGYGWAIDLAAASLDDRYRFLFGRRMADCLRRRISGRFLLLRALSGSGWGRMGLGASLAMESLPNARAWFLFSGILQQGYAFWYLLGRAGYWIVFPIFGWRGLLSAGALPRCSFIYIRAHVPESPVWDVIAQAAKGPTFDLRRFAKKRALLIYAALLMTAFNYMSHGIRISTQLFLKNSALWGQREINDYHCLCHRHDFVAEPVIGLSFATIGPAPLHYFGAVCGMLFDSGVGFRARDNTAHCGGFSCNSWCKAHGEWCRCI